MTKETITTGQVVREAQSQENYDPTAKQKAAAKLSRIPIKVMPGEVLKKPDWIRVKAGSPTTRFYEIKDILRKNKLVTVCEEASCPNIGECFGKGTATFMIMGDKCTRRCPFCDVGHGRPDPLDVNEPANLARTIADLKLSYVVITSVDRDDLRDGGASSVRNFESSTTRCDEPQLRNCAAFVQRSSSRLRLSIFFAIVEEIQSAVSACSNQKWPHGGPW